MAEEIDPDLALRLGDAVKIAFPFGGMTVLLDAALFDHPLYVVERDEMLPGYVPDYQSSPLGLPCNLLDSSPYGGVGLPWR